MDKEHLVTKGHKSHVKGTVHCMCIPQSQVGHPVSEVVSENLMEVFLKERLASCVCFSWLSLRSLLVRDLINI